MPSLSFSGLIFVDSKQPEQKASFDDIMSNTMGNRVKSTAIRSRKSRLGLRLAQIDRTRPKRIGNYNEAINDEACQLNGGEHVVWVQRFGGGRTVEWRSQGTEFVARER